jgi:hypothetical protein
VASVFDDWDNVCAVSGHVDQITTRAMGELDSENGSSWSNNICNMRDGSSRSSTEVQNLCARLNEDFIQTTQDTSCQLASEGIPDTVFDLGDAGSTIFIRRTLVLDTDALFAVDRLAGCHILGNQHIFLAAGDEDTGMSMGFLLLSELFFTNDRET